MESSLGIVYPRTFKRYNIKDLKVIYHDIPDEEGKLINTKCVEFIVIGRNHSWPLWALYDEFVLVNPHVQI